MTVKELIELLSEYPDNMEIDEVCCSNSWSGKDYEFSLYDIKIKNNKLIIS